MACQIAFGNVHYDQYKRNYNYTNKHYNDSEYCNDFMDTGLFLLFEIHPNNNVLAIIL